MKSKSEILEKVYTPLVMKSKTISHIIIEGTDGVGKTTLLLNLLKAYNYRYVVYDRGELSNIVYAKKYGRPFVSLQRNCPFIYVLLTCDKEVLKERIYNRAKAQNWSIGQLEAEIMKIDDQDLFIEYAKHFENDYHIITVDTTNLTAEQVCETVKNKVDEYVNNMATDKEETAWNVNYRKVYERLGHKFEVRNNQPYVDGKMMMSESTWQNGAYETFTDKSCPDNLIFSMVYSEDVYCKSTENKDLDFAYVINSKINRRHEIIDYYMEMLKYNKTCLVSEKIYNAFEDERFVSMPKAFGDDFIKQLSRANATIYCARDLEYLKLQTARLYEGIISKQLVFVDKESDKNCDMLKQIFKDRYDIINLLYVTPNEFIQNYETIMSNEDLRQEILNIQSAWYENLKRSIENA